MNLLKKEPVFLNDWKNYGLEGQWEPEETNTQSLVHRLYQGGMGTDHYSGNVYSDQLKEFIG